MTLLKRPGGFLSINIKRTDCLERGVGGGGEAVQSLSSFVVGYGHALVSPLIFSAILITLFTFFLPAQIPPNSITHVLGSLVFLTFMSMCTAELCV